MKHIFNQFIVNIIPYLPLALVRLVAKKYVAGENIADALNVVKLLNKQGYSTTLDILGEHINDIDTTKYITSEYKYLLCNIHEQKLDCNISIKPSHIGMDISSDCIFKNMTNIIETARRINHFVRIDMEDSTLTDATISLYNKFKKQYDHVGIVLQAYLFRSIDDLSELQDNIETNLRICKGIYREPDNIAIQDRYEINNNFIKLIRMAFKKNIYVCIATHDLSIIKKSYSIIDELNIPKDRFEFQVLYGVPMYGWLERHLKHGYKVRVYIPFGEAWYDYSLRRIKENPDIASYILKDIFNK